MWLKTTNCTEGYVQIPSRPCLLVTFSSPEAATIVSPRRVLRRWSMHSKADLLKKQSKPEPHPHTARLERPTEPSVCIFTDQHFWEIITYQYV